MANLNDRCKATISEYPIGRELSLFLTYYSKFASAFPPTSYEGIAKLAITDPANTDIAKAAKRLIKQLLNHLLILDAAEELPPHQGSPYRSLYEDILNLTIRFPRQADSETITTLLDRAIKHTDDDELIWSAVYGLFKSIPSSSLSHSELRSDWGRTFFEDSLIGLRQQMKDCTSSSLAPYYAKTLVFVQSSGMGKSRLVDTLGTTCPMINFILCDGSGGCPTTGGHVRAFILQPVPEDLPSKTWDSVSMAALIWHHSVMFGILEASLKIFNAWVERQNYDRVSLEELASIRHGEMELLGIDKMGDTRPQGRIDFCKAVVQEASIVATRLADDLKWRRLFIDERPSAIRINLESSTRIRDLLCVAERLIGNLKKFRRTDPSDNRLLIIAFDHVTSLFSPFGSRRLDSELYIALNRMCSFFKNYPLWFLFLSTEPKMAKILPLDSQMLVDEDQDFKYSNRPTCREGSSTDHKLRVFPAFVAFPLDIEDRSRMRNPALKRIELIKPMVEFSHPRHMAIFGRRLWYAYSDNPNRMYNVARSKLVDNELGARYMTTKRNHVFAVLSFRLLLDPCLKNSLSLPLVNTAVRSFMRVVTSIDQSTGVLHTVTPSEPVLAKVAMEHLCELGNWPNSVTALAQDLLQQGLIEKGFKGELFIRLVLILAHDSIRRLATTPENMMCQINLELMPTFTVKEFLLALYAEGYDDLISKIDTKILQAKMNFTHFTSTHGYLPTGGAIIDLCHDLLRRSAALQLGPNNPTFDQLIPIYFGSDKELFNPLECGAIVIQDRNRVNATTPSHIFREQFAQLSTCGSPRKTSKKQSTKDDQPQKPPIRQSTEYAFKGMLHPILFLLFDLNANPSTTSRVQVSCSTNNTLPRVWAIHSRGHTDKVFRCLSVMGIRNAAEIFSSFSSVGEEGMYDGIVRRNMVFDEMDRDFRYAKIKPGGIGYVEVLDDGSEQDDDDIEVEDA